MTKPAVSSAISSVAPPPLTPEQLKQLEQLKDIRLPEPVSWWPLAIGWWLLAVILLLLIISLWWWVRRRQRGVKNLALAELQQLSEDDIQRLSARLSSLIRRIARQRGDIQATTLSGDAWVAYLCQDDAMPRDMARCLAAAPYTTSTDMPSAEALKTATAQWIRRRA